MDQSKKSLTRTTVFLFLFSISCLVAQTGVNSEGLNGMDSVISSFMRKWNIPGGSVAIVKDGNLFYSRGFGYSDFARSLPAEPNSLYRIASISKPVTALAIMKLVEEGRLSLSSKVFGQGQLISDTYFLETITDQRIYDITILHLLEHTSGWDRNIPYGPFRHCDPAFFPLYVTEAEAEPNPVGDSTLIRFKLGNGLNYAPGTHFSYSNIGYLVLGKIISRVTGMSYETYIKENILEPAGIFDMHLGRNLKQEKMEREVDYISHVMKPSCYGDGTMVLSQYGGFNLEAMNAHGGWISTAPDLARLLVALKNGSLLEEGTKETMLSGGSVNTHYALGWQVNEKGNYWHTGSLDGTSAFAANTVDGYTWVFLFNSRSDNSPAFWKAFDNLPHTAIKTIRDLPRIDLFPPLFNCSFLTVHALSYDKVHLQWLNGDGDQRLVVASTESLGSLPLDGIRYLADAEFAVGDRVNENGFIVYNGTGNRTTVSNLDPSRTYYFTVIEFKQNKKTGNKEVYKLGGRETVSIKTEPRLKM